MIRRIAALSALSALSALAFAPAAFAAPHQEQQDGCDHGATSKPCRPDPQPDHGKECDKHGRHGGVNEDHCSDSEVAPSTSTTVTTSPAPTTTTTSASSPVAPTTTSTTASSSSTLTAPETPSTSSTPATSGPARHTESDLVTWTRSELPATGTASALLISLAVGLITFGVSLLAIRWALR